MNTVIQTLTEQGLERIVAPARARDALLDDVVAEEQQQPAWERAIDRLLDWWRDDQAMRDEGLEPPTRARLELALQVVRELSRQGGLAPTAVVPDGEGGLVLEWRHGRHFHEVEISGEGTIEQRIFRDSALVHRRVLGSMG